MSMRAVEGRYWGVWTEGKLDVLRRYLEAFGRATQGAPHRVYLDLFAGRLDNYARDTEASIEGSAEIALTVPQPPFTHYCLFEQPQRARAMEHQLRARYPDREIRIYAGDCNSTLQRALRDLSALRRAPTFALIDPDGPDVRWSTLEALADHKAREPTKVELWLLFPHAMFTRMLPRDSTKLASSAAEKMTALFGSQDWRPIYDERVRGSLEPVDARQEYVNLMRWLIEKRLHYRVTHSLAVFTDQERPLYDMIFATDSAAGERIMSHLHEWATNGFPLMRAQARRVQRDRERESSGQTTLFGPDEGGFPLPAHRPGQRVRYVHEPPWLPIGQEVAGE